MVDPSVCLSVHEQWCILWLYDTNIKPHVENRTIWQSEMAEMQRSRRRRREKHSVGGCTDGSILFHRDALFTIV